MRDLDAADADDDDDDVAAVGCGGGDGCGGGATAALSVRGSPRKSAQAPAEFASLDADGGEGLGELSCVVLDSPYCDFPTLASDLTRQRLISGFSPPWFVTQMVLGMLDKSVRAVAGFSVYELSPVSTAAIMHVPALFLHAEDDNLIGKHHVERLVRPIHCAHRTTHAPPDSLSRTSPLRSDASPPPSCRSSLAKSSADIFHRTPCTSPSAGRTRTSPRTTTPAA